MPRAVIVPETALLVPGAAGRARVLVDVRAAALDAARTLVAAAPRAVLVVAPGPRSRWVDAAEACASLTGLGLAERHLGWPAPCRLAGCPEHTGLPRAEVLAPASAVGVRLLAAAGWAGPTTVRELSASDAPAGSAMPGSATPHDWDAVLVLGSLSARRGADAPRAADPRAVIVDAAFAAALEDPVAGHLDRLVASDPVLAAELDVGGVEPWRALATLASGGAVTGRLEAADDSLGVDHRVWTWRWSR